MKIVINHVFQIMNTVFIQKKKKKKEEVTLVKLVDTLEKDFIIFPFTLISDLDFNVYIVHIYQEFKYIGERHNQQNLF
jgi:hypothetical protein